MTHVLRRIDAAKTSELIAKFQPIPTFSEKIPLYVNPRMKTSLYFRLELGEIIRPAYLDIKSNTRTIFTLSLIPCYSEKGDSCRQAQEMAEESSAKLANWRLLPEGVQISSLLYGDANKDRVNDVLLRLSNGAALLYQSLHPAAGIDVK